MTPRKRDEGVALLLALLFVVLLSTIVVEFCYEMQVEASFVGNQEDSLEAYIAAKSAVAVALSVLAEDLVAGQTPPGAAHANVDSLDEPWAVDGVPYQPLNNAVMRARIADEYGKLNLNALINQDSGEPVEAVAKTLHALFQARQAEEDPTDAIIDWLDDDEEPYGSTGAESDIYGSLETPYSCKNGPMNSIEELLLIRGMTPDLFFGNAELGQEPLSSLLTVHGHPTGRININTAGVELLEAIGEALDEKSGLATMVQDKRDQAAPFQSREDIKSSVEGAGYPEAAKWFAADSRVFRIYGDGQALVEENPPKVRIEAYVKREQGAGSGAFTFLDWRVIR